MAFTKEIYYEGSADGLQAVYSANWSAQTFTTGGSGFTLTKLGIHGGVEGTPTNAKIEIYATSAGKPTGSALATATMVVGDMASYVAPDWYEVEMDSSYILSASTQYALVMTCTGTAADGVHWSYDDTSPSYADGTLVFSSNSGSTWTIASAYDFLFRTYSGSDSVVVNMEGSTSFTFSASGTIGNISALAGTTSMTFSTSGFLTQGMLSGTEANRLYKRLIACANDQLYYEDI